MKKPVIRPYREVEKPLAMRIVELVRALQLLADALEHLRKGEVRHLVTLSGQLRALLTERRHREEPLLLYVASVLERELRVFCMPDVNNPEFPAELRKDLLMHLSGFPVTVERQFEAQIQVTFREFLDYQILFFKEKPYTPRSIIDWYANKAGGAHYSSRLPEDFAELLALNLMSLQPVAQALAQIGSATVQAGWSLLKSLIDFEIHALLVLPNQAREQANESNILWDSSYEDTPMRVTLLLNKRLMPSLFVRGLQGVAARVDCDRLIDWSEPRHIHASMIIQPNLSTRLQLAVDGTTVGRVDVPEPLFVLSNVLDYKKYLNRAADGNSQAFSFGLIELVMYSKEIEQLDLANLLIYFASKRENRHLPAALYLPNSYGYAPRGTNDFQMSGRVLHSTVAKVLAGDYDDESHKADTDGGTV